MDLDRKTVRRGLRQTEWRPYERGDADREDAGGGRGAGRDERTGTLNRVSRRPFLRIRSRRYRSEFCRGAAGQSGQSLSTAPPPLWPLRGSPPGCAARHRPPGFVSGRWGNGPAGGLRLDDAGGRGDRAGLDADGADRTVEGRGERVDVGRQTPGPARGRCGRAFPGRTGEEAPASRPSRALPHVPPEPRRAQPVVVQAPAGTAPSADARRYAPARASPTTDEGCHAGARTGRRGTGRLHRGYADVKHLRH